MFLLDDYGYDLPDELIAQEPVAHRDRSRLFVLNRKTLDFSHRVFDELHRFFCPSDVLVINDTRVIPGRLFGRKATGGKVEVLILDYSDNGIDSNNARGRVLQCLVKSSKRPRPGMVLYFDQGLEAEILTSENGICSLCFYGVRDFDAIIHKIGHMPLPPYIKRVSGASNDADRTSYQTVYADRAGAIAAPTAGLHFSKQMLNDMAEKGVQIVKITLHVGYGTFLPVRVRDIRHHPIHSERYGISPEAAGTINRSRANGGRIVAVGTTCVRTLEFASDEDGVVASGRGNCDLFIYPGYRFKVVDAMLTNFHLPKSTLLMLVSAFAGHKTIFNAYHEAIKQKYRFYSYGDAMFIM